MDERATPDEDDNNNVCAYHRWRTVRVGGTDDISPAEYLTVCADCGCEKSGDEE